MLIEDAYNHSGSKVVLVSHSLGGLTTSTFLHTMSQQWKDQYVHAWVSAAGVFGGAVKVLETLGSRHFNHIKQYRKFEHDFVRFFLNLAL